MFILFIIKKLCQYALFIFYYQLDFVTPGNKQA
jgi:hypothetical protein